MEGIARVHLDDGGPADLHREIRSDTVGILWVLNRGRTRQVCPGPWCFCVMLAVAITSRGTHGCACNKRVVMTRCCSATVLVRLRPSRSEKLQSLEPARPVLRCAGFFLLRHQVLLTSHNPFPLGSLLG